MTANVYIEGVIGESPMLSFTEEGTTLADVRRQYESYGDDVDKVNVFINSPGGDVFEGFAIYDYLKSLPVEVNTIGQGRIFSIASIIFLAGDKRMLQPNATYLIHNPLTAMYGESKDFARAAEELDNIKNRLVNLYSRVANIPADSIAAAMDVETSYTAEDAVALGFATGVYVPEIKAIAFVNPNQNDMSETKDRKSLIEQIRNLANSLANGATNEVAADVQPEPEQPQAPDNSEIDKLTAENEDLKAQLAAIKEAQEKAEGEKAQAEAEAKQLTAEVTALKESLKVINAKLDELEDMPAAKVEAPKPVAVERKNTMQLPEDLLQKDLQFSNLLSR